MPSSEPILLYSENESKITLQGLVDDLGNFINNALVTLTVVDGQNQVVGGIQNVTMTNIDNFGNYQYTILAATFNPTPGLSGYQGIIQASVSGVPKYKVYKPITVAKRIS